MGRKHQGGGDSGQRSQEKQGAGDGKRYTMDCREAGQDCSLSMSGSMEEVMSTGEMHARKAHGLRGTEDEVRRQLRENIKEEGGRAQEERPKAGAAGAGRTEQRPNMPPA
jgi:predicted small metal-binding protein